MTDDVRDEAPAKCVNEIRMKKSSSAFPEGASTKDRGWLGQVDGAG
jgi:hypothetical protein